MITDRTDCRTFTGAEFLVHVLASNGVTHVFGGHGGAVVPLVDEIEKHPAVTWVYCRCEVNASQAAAAYGKLHGRLACCVATSGPGAAHLLSGLVDADQDRVPMLCITGMKDTSHIRFADFQDIDQGAIFKMAGLAYSEAAIDVNQLLPLTRNAVTLSLASHRVSHIAVPVDVQQREVIARTHFCLGTAYQRKVATPASDLQIGTLVMALRAEIEAKRHVLIACGYRAHALGKEVERLAELLRAPVMTSYDGKGVTNERHPLSYGVVGVYGNAGTPSSVDLLDDCDTIISICVTELSELLANKKGLQVRRLIQIDERLIAGDAFRFSPSTVFSCGFLRNSLRRVIQELEKGLAMFGNHEHRLSVTCERDCMRENEEIHHPKSGMDVWEKVSKAERRLSKPVGTPSTFLKGVECHDHKLTTGICSTDYCHPAVFFDVMSRALGDDAVICADIGDNALWMASSLAAKRGQRFLTSEHMGIMGYGINAGLAASVSAASGKQTSCSTNSGPRQTLVVAGDGGIQMSLNELATMRDHGSNNVLVVVIINSRLGRVQNETWGPRLHADGCHIGSPDYVKLFEAYGYPNGIKLLTSNEDAVTKAIHKGWLSASEQGVCVIEVHQDPQVHPIMHKLSAKDKIRRSFTNWEERTRNSMIKSLFPKIATDHWREHNDMLQNWLNGLTKAQCSEPYWLDSVEFVSLSASKVVQEQLESMRDTIPGGKAPTMFATHEAQHTFDSHFQSSFLNSFPSEVCESVLSNGTSNGYPLCLQLLACPKDFTFPLHAHPNVELDIPLVGDLWERRSLNVLLPEESFTREKPVTCHEGNFFKKPSEDEVKESYDALEGRTVFEDLGSSGEFVDRVAHQGQVLFNETGSVHQSYTKDGCLILALWSQVHAHFAEGNFRQQTGVESVILGLNIFGEKNLVE